MTETQPITHEMIHALKHEGQVLAATKLYRTYLRNLREQRIIDRKEMKAEENKLYRIRHPKAKNETTKR